MTFDEQIQRDIDEIERSTDPVEGYKVGYILGQLLSRIQNLEEELRSQRDE